MSKKTRNTNSKYERTNEKGIFYDKKTKDYRLTLFIGVDNNGKATLPTKPIDLFFALC